MVARHISLSCKCLCIASASTYYSTIANTQPYRWVLANQMSWLCLWLTRRWRWRSSRTHRAVCIHICYRLPRGHNLLPSVWHRLPSVRRMLPSIWHGLPHKACRWLRNRIRIYVWSWRRTDILCVAHRWSCWVFHATSILGKSLCGHKFCTTLVACHTSLYSTTRRTNHQFCTTLVTKPAVVFNELFTFWTCLHRLVSCVI